MHDKGAEASAERSEAAARRPSGVPPHARVLWARVTYASAMFLLLGLSLALPASPVNAVALLAAGSAHAGVWSIVVSLVATALIGAAGMRLALRRTAQWMAAGTS